ncbi:MAG: acyl-CoA reductase [Saprospiraceae bacterium]|nr:acyl-CoA reductase [Saprospiraceae bacterium]
MKKNERIELLAELGHYLSGAPDDALEQIVQRSYMENRWFTPENTHKALQAIATSFLDRDKLIAWTGQYAIADREHPAQTIGLVMAGNIPLVGFHDWLCVFVAGHRAKVKLSEKDKFLLPFLVKKLGDWAFESWEYTEFLSEGDKLGQVDAVIATGSNNSARYFEEYFSKYPHVIRRNRNAVAILNGTETFGDLYALGSDVFTYFGLGCRNVSKLYVPKGYVFDPLLEALHEYRELANHDKYKNNFDYNLTLYLMNAMPYQNNGCVLLREDPTLASRIASVHFEYYEDLTELARQLGEHRDEIQCVAGAVALPGWNVLSFGQTQTPGLADYPDGVDVMTFLTNL